MVILTWSPGDKKQKHAKMSPDEDDGFVQAPDFKGDFDSTHHIYKVTKGYKNKEKKRSTLRHFDFCLSRAAVIKANGKTLTKSKDCAAEDITDNLVGKFATYMATKARVNCDPHGKKLKFLSAYGYFSA